MARLEDTFTFLGVTEEGHAVFMDIAALADEREALLHCQGLLADHASGAFIEIWRGAGLVATVPRTISQRTTATVSPSAWYLVNEART